LCLERCLWMGASCTGYSEGASCVPVSLTSQTGSYPVMHCLQAARNLIDQQGHITRTMCLQSKEEGLKRHILGAEQIDTLLFTVAGNWHSSPIRTACFSPRSCNGIRDSHSFSCAASSIRNKSILWPFSFAYPIPDTVQKTKEALSRQNSFIWVTELVWVEAWDPA
jgi:hypothetical protein